MPPVRASYLHLHQQRIRAQVCSRMHITDKHFGEGSSGEQHRVALPKPDAEGVGVQGVTVNENCSKRAIRQRLDPHVTRPVVEVFVAIGVRHAAEFGALYAVFVLIDCDDLRIGD
jgi:hypothetical protein